MFVSLQKIKLKSAPVRQSRVDREQCGKSSARHALREPHVCIGVIHNR